jgi:hypothetical protein
MQPLINFRSGAYAFIVTALITSLVACASRPHLVYHSFAFDARWDSPGIEILDYRYGASNHPGARGCPKQYAHCDKIAQQAGITGDMLLGDELYVKWRIKSTDTVHEDIVNLRDRLPTDMQKQTLRFVIRESQLYVFVISSEKRNPNPCPPREQLCRITDPSCPSAYDRVFSMYCHKNFVQIYPNQSTSQKPQ